MTTLSTHDTKRGEDVRARLAVLSELPGRWAEQVKAWMEYAPLPDPAFAHLLWQTAVGAWPIERERLHAYVEKAAREAGASTSWADPDPAFEQAVHAVVDQMYDDPSLHDELTELAAAIAPAGWSNSLGQKLIQLTMPGVPDTYQGTELWDNSLVDPDNRRPVDFDVRRELLARIDGGWRPPVDTDGAAKLLVVSRTLRLRRDAPGAVHHLPAGARARAGGPARGGLRPGRRDRRGDPAAAGPGTRRRVVRHSSVTSRSRDEGPVHRPGLQWRGDPAGRPSGRLSRRSAGSFHRCPWRLRHDRIHACGRRTPTGCGCAWPATPTTRCAPPPTAGGGSTCPTPAPDYSFLLNDDETPLPDPRSPWQPAGVHGPSRRYDHAAFAWTDSAWTGRQLPGSILYELHIGTFTPEGTFDAAIDRLDHLVASAST